MEATTEGGPVGEQRDDLAESLAAYERGMRPAVGSAQAMADDGAATLFPASVDAIEARNAELRAHATAP